jgi:hypothetical protein
VLVICTAALLCMCGFLLYGTIDQSVNVIGAIVFVIVVEITPLLLLIFTVYAKRANVFSIWYSRARSRLSSASHSTSDDTTRSMPSDEVSHSQT